MGNERVASVHDSSTLLSITWVVTAGAAGGVTVICARAAGPVLPAMSTAATQNETVPEKSTRLWYWVV